MNNQNQFYELLMGCPFGQPLKECVIEKYRRMSLLEWIDNFKLMNRHEISELVGDEHIKCFKCRSEQKVAS